MFGFKDEGELSLVIKDLLKEHGPILSGRIGASAYASVEQPTSTYVKRALKYLVAADLVDLRIMRMSQDIKQVEGIDAFKLRRTQERYIREAEAVIDKIETAAGASDDFATGVVVSSHFSEDL